MEGFRTGLLQLRSKGSPSDITQSASGVQDRAKELLQTLVIPREYCASVYDFTFVNIDVLLRDDENFVGRVVKSKDSGKIKSY